MIAQCVEDWLVFRSQRIANTEYDLSFWKVSKIRFNMVWHEL